MNPTHEPYPFPMRALGPDVFQQGDVNWFCFWLKGEEDSDPPKADEYTRWRELRKLQENNHDNARR